MKILPTNNHSFSCNFLGGKEKLVREVLLTVANPNGLHTRPSAIIAREALEGLKEARAGEKTGDVFVSITKADGSGNTIDASSILSILTGCFTKNTKVILKSSENFPEIRFNAIKDAIEKIEPQKQQK